MNTRLLSQLLLASSMAFITLCTLVPPPAAWVERWYARTVFPILNRLVVPLTAPLSFSLTSVFLLLLTVSLIGVVIRTLRSQRSPPALLRSWLRGVFIVALFFGTWFYLTWGLNYRRSSIEDLLTLPQTGVTTEEVLALAKNLAATIEDTATSPVDVEGATASLSRSLNRLVEELTDTSLVLPNEVKTLPAGSLLSFGYAGITSPFFLEAHIDAALPPAAAVAVGVHELAHLAGFAGEADADLVAAIAGLSAAHPYARYAVALHLFSQVVIELPEVHRRPLLTGLPERSRQDLATLREVSARYYRGNLARPVSRAYDTYLRSQGVEAGLEDYGRVVTLLVHIGKSETHPFLQEQSP